MQKIKFIRIRIYVLLCVSCLILSSCKTGTLFVGKSYSFITGNENIQKLISIDPIFSKIDKRQSIEDFYYKTESEKLKFNEILISNSKASKIDLKIISQNTISYNDVNYFNDLLPLKHDILRAFFTFGEYNSKKIQNYDEINHKSELFNPKTKYFSKPPLISSKYSYLSLKYGTPYFAIHGIASYIYKKQGRLFLLLFNPPLGLIYSFKPNVSTKYFNVIVNIETGELIYVELRETNDLPNEISLNTMIYDSFQILRKKIK